MSLAFATPVQHRWHGADFVAASMAARELVFPEINDIPANLPLGYKISLYPAAFSYRHSIERSSKRLMNLTRRYKRYMADANTADDPFQNVRLVEEIRRLDTLGFINQPQQMLVEILDGLIDRGGQHMAGCDHVWREKRRAMNTLPGEVLNHEARTLGDVIIKTLVVDNWLSVAAQALPEVLTPDTWEQILPSSSGSRDLVHAAFVYALIRYVWLMTKDEQQADQLRPYLVAS